MNNLLEIIRRFTVKTLMVFAIFVVINIIGLGILISDDGVKFRLSSHDVEGLIEEQNHYEGKSKILQGYEWAMIIDGKGKRIWSNTLPEDFPAHFTPADIARLTKWYYKDYPVKVYPSGDKLLILGEAKNSLWKHGLSVPLSVLRSIPVFIIVNLLMVIGLLMFMSFRLYRTLQPVVNGIDGLIQLKVLDLPETGQTQMINRQLNKVSSILNTREEARKNWIHGVSHDIRTPLSLIMCHGESLKDSSHYENKVIGQKILSETHKITNLIDDLNMMNKLVYGEGKLNIEKVNLAPYLRQVTASIYNRFQLGEDQEVLLAIGDTARDSSCYMDKKLMTRALDNILSNAIRHNQDQWNKIEIIFHVDEVVNIVIKDDGIGIPEEVLKVLEGENSEDMPHIMGLFIVKDIIEAHRGSLEIKAYNSGTEVIISLPKEEI